MDLAALLRRPGARARAPRPLGGPAVRPTRFVGTLADLEPADPRLAEDIYAGVFHCGGTVLDVARGSPFLVEAPSQACAVDLHGFAWLRHLAAADTAIARSNGRALVDEWLRAGRALPRLARAPDVAARRLRALLAHGPILLADASPRFRARAFALLADHVTRLDRAARRRTNAPGRVDAAIAVAAAAAVLDVPKPFADRALARLAIALDAAILPDGGPLSRCPDALLDLLPALLPAVAATEARGRAVPPAVRAAIDRAGPMLAFFRHADGTLARFNGTGATRARLMSIVADALPEPGAPPLNARHVGYQRLEAADIVVLVDTGPPPPAPFAGRAHAAPLAFELSDASGPVVVNCGAAPPTAGPSLARALRATAAHATLVIAEEEAAPTRPRRPDGYGRIESVPDAAAMTVRVERHPGEGRTVVRATHDGWRARFGIVHERTLSLESDGGALAGRDSLLGPGSAEPLPFAIRFHLHPAVKTSVSPSRRAVVLTAADGTIWRFGVEEAVDLAVEESVFVTPDGAVVSTRQIRLAATAAATPVVRWRLERQLRGR